MQNVTAVEKTKMNKPKKSPRKIRTRYQNNPKAYLYLAPALVSIFFLTLLPIIYTIYIAFTNYNLNHLYDYKFVGLENFKDVLAGPFSKVFFPVFGWTIMFAIISTFGCFFVGLILALLLNNRDMKERAFYKAILIIPWALPATIAVLSWQGLYNTEYGAINVALMNLHLIKQPIEWLTNPLYARMAILIANIWMGFPYMMNVCLGSLSAIPDDFYEAADIDGASNWIKFTKITLPSLARTAYPLLISSFAFNFNNFTSAFLITGGNPPRLDTQFAGYTDILASTTYKLTMQFNRYELGSALAIILFLIVGTLSFVQMKASGQFKEVE